MGTWLVDNVPVGDGSPERYRLARADNVQVVWTHNCEHGVIRGYQVAWLHETEQGAAAYQTVHGEDGWPIDCEFGPEQLVARLDDQDVLPAQVITKLEGVGVQETQLAKASNNAVEASTSNLRRRGGNPCMCTWKLQQPRLLMSGLDDGEAAAVQDAAAELGWELIAERIEGTDARVVLFAGLAGAEWVGLGCVGSDAREVDDQAAARDTDSAAAESSEYLIRTVSEALDLIQAEGVVVCACSARPDPSVRAETLPWILDAARARHVAEWRLRVPLAMLSTGDESVACDGRWDAGRAIKVMHATIDGGDVSYGAHSWFDVSEVVAVDGLVDEGLRERLLAAISAEGLGLASGGEPWHPEEGPDPRVWLRGGLSDVPHEEGSADLEGDTANTAGGVGLSPEALERLCDEDNPPAAIVELQTRLARFLESANVGLPPADVASSATPIIVSRMSDACFGGSITQIAANAPTAADGDGAFSWHIDADPMLLPPSPWTDAFGRYPNRALGKPRFVTALIYLSPQWEAAWGAPTRFLDLPTGRVLDVQPAPGRVCLMDQDVTHAMSAPHRCAGSRPRYSLALKLVLHPNAPDGVSKHKQAVRIAPVGWGEPEPFGSAMRGESSQRLRV